jgi:putative transport protein
MAVIITVVPLVSGYGFARKVLKLSPLEVLGGICGGMTSTPGLGAVSESVDSEVPAMSYAAAYPAALILMTVFTQIIVRVLG